MSCDCAAAYFIGLAVFLVVIVVCNSIGER